MRLNRVCVIPDRGCACGVVGCNVSDTVMSVRGCVWLAEVVWDGLPEWVRVPYVKTMRPVLLFSRVAAGP